MSAVVKPGCTLVTMILTKDDASEVLTAVLEPYGSPRHKCRHRSRALTELSPATIRHHPIIATDGKPIVYGLPPLHGCVADECVDAVYPAPAAEMRDRGWRCRKSPLVAALFGCACVATTVDGFITPRWAHDPAGPGRARRHFECHATPDTSHSSVIGGSSAENIRLPRLAELLAGLRALPGERERTLRLVEMGDAYGESEWRLGEAEGGRRVPGCTAVVNIWADVTVDGQQVTVHGTADARLSRGLVALVCRGLDGSQPREVLELDPIAVASGLGLRLSLTPGRLNGVANIVRTIQTAVEDRLKKDSPSAAPEQDRAGVSEGPRKEEASSSLLQVPLIEPTTEDVAVLLSGGVDSSVALNLMLKEGRKPVCYYLKIWLEDEVAHLNQCPWEEDWAYAEAVTRQAGVRLEAVPMQKEYWERVVAHTIAEARAGRTPNPDILCNSLVKFGVFYDAVGKNYPTVATGHYARVEHPHATSNEPSTLLRSADRHKDQTYFLSRLRQDQLQRAAFPIGAYTKAQIRSMADSLNLPTKARKDSQGICFLGKLRFDDFLRHYLGESPGDVVWLETGELVGRHNGLWFHTIGQRKGIVPVLSNQYRPLGPWYVAAKDPGSNTLVITNRPDALGGGSQDGGEVDSRRTFKVVDVTWIEGAPPKEILANGEAELEVQIRHGPNSHPGSRVRAVDTASPLSSPLTSSPSSSSSSPSERPYALSANGREWPPPLSANDEREGRSTSAWSVVEVTLPKEDSLAPGQYAAFYQGDRCLGAGVISEETWAVPQRPARCSGGR